MVSCSGAQLNERARLTSPPLPPPGPSRAQGPHSMFSSLKLGLSFWGVHGPAACSAAGELGRGRPWGLARQRGKGQQGRGTTVIWSRAAAGNGDVHSGPGWSGRLGSPRAMTGDRDAERWTSPGRGQRGAFFTGVGGYKEPERVKSQLGSAGAPPLGVEIQSAAKLPRRQSPGRLAELINF